MIHHAVVFKSSEHHQRYSQNEKWNKKYFLPQFQFMVKILLAILKYWFSTKNADVHSGEQKWQNDLKNQMISKLHLEDRKFFRHPGASL